jgi:hypothetical protein
MAWHCTPRAPNAMCRRLPDRSALRIKLRSTYCRSARIGDLSLPRFTSSWFSRSPATVALQHARRVPEAALRSILAEAARSIAPRSATSRATRSRRACEPTSTGCAPATRTEAGAGPGCSRSASVVHRRAAARALPFARVSRSRDRGSRAGRVCTARDPRCAAWLDAVARAGRCTGRVRCPSVRLGGRVSAAGAPSLAGWSSIGLVSRSSASSRRSFTSCLRFARSLALHDDLSARRCETLSL